MKKLNQEELKQRDNCVNHLIDAGKAFLHTSIRELSQNIKLFDKKQLSQRINVMESVLGSFGADEQVEFIIEAITHYNPEIGFKGFEKILDTLLDKDFNSYKIEERSLGVCLYESGNNKLIAHLLHQNKDIGLLRQYITLYKRTTSVDEIPQRISSSVANIALSRVVRDTMNRAIFRYNRSSTSSRELLSAVGLELTEADISSIIYPVTIEQLRDIGTSEHLEIDLSRFFNMSLGRRVKSQQLAATNAFLNRVWNTKSPAVGTAQIVNEIVNQLAGSTTLGESEDPKALYFQGISEYYRDILPETSREKIDAYTLNVVLGSIKEKISRICSEVADGAERKITKIQQSKDSTSMEVQLVKNDAKSSFMTQAAQAIDSRFASMQSFLVSSSYISSFSDKVKQATTEYLDALLKDSNKYYSGKGRYCNLFEKNNSGTAKVSKLLGEEMAEAMFESLISQMKTWTVQLDSIPNNRKFKI